MKIFLMDQGRKFDMHLRELMRRPVMPYERLLKEKISTIEIQSNKELRDVNVDFLFDYKIFPPNIMSHKTQWSSENREMRIGDTILQQVYLPPIKSFSQKIIFTPIPSQEISCQNWLGPYFHYPTRPTAPGRD